ncbi:hypothetical protein [Sorangium sp. So ce1000]
MLNPQNTELIKEGMEDLDEIEALECAMIGCGAASPAQRLRRVVL